MRKLCMPRHAQAWMLVGGVCLTACAGPIGTFNGDSKYPIDPELVHRYSLEEIENIYHDKLTTADMRGDIAEQLSLLRKVAFVQDMGDHGEELENTLSRLLSLYHDIQPVDTLALAGIHLWLAIYFEDSERPEEAKMHFGVGLDLDPTIAALTTTNEIRFIAYDTAPVPIGGYSAILENVVYPESAQLAGIEGTVIVQAFVSKSGGAGSTEILHGVTAELNHSAGYAIQRTRFLPASRRGRPVVVWISIPVNFRLR